MNSRASSSVQLRFAMTSVMSLSALCDLSLIAVSVVPLLEEVDEVFGEDFDFGGVLETVLANGLVCCECVEVAERETERIDGVDKVWDGFRGSGGFRGHVPSFSFLKSFASSESSGEFEDIGKARSDV